MSWYVYGVTRPLAEGAPPLETGPGVLDAPVTLLRTASVVAIVSPVGPEVADLEHAASSVVLDAVQRHDDVLVALAEDRDVLPVRFGTVLPDEDAVSTWLADPSGRLGAALDAVAGAEEWVVTVAPDPGAEAPEPEVSAASPGHAFFARRRAVADRRTETRRRAVAAAEALDHDLRALARASTPMGLKDPAAIARGAYLVPRDRRERLLARVATVPDAAVEVVGPLPAYRFASVDEHP